MRFYATLALICFALSACSSNKSYENQVFPKGKWQPVKSQSQAGAWQ